MILADDGDLIIVDIGADAFIPVRAVFGGIFPRWLNGALLSSLRTSGKRSVYSSGLMHSSEIIEWNTRIVLYQVFQQHRCSTMYATK